MYTIKLNYLIYYKTLLDLKTVIISTFKHHNEIIVMIVLFIYYKG